MAPKNLFDVTNLVETCSTEEVNAFLKKGWKLIDTYKDYLYYETDEQSVIYVLGKMED